MEEIKEAIRQWNNNEEGMQDSYPEGLAQYLGEHYNGQHDTLKFLAEIVEAICEDSSWALLRFGSKNPSKSGVDNYEDYGSLNLYGLSTELRKKPTT